LRVTRETAARVEEPMEFKTWTAIPAKLPFRSGGKLGRCFWNAHEWCRKEPTLRYAEGIVYDPDGWPRHHGWAVDEKDGIVECRQRDVYELVYVGFVFSMVERLERIINPVARTYILTPDEILKCTPPVGRFRLQLPLQEKLRSIAEELRLAARQPRNSLTAR